MSEKIFSEQPVRIYVAVDAEGVVFDTSNRPFIPLNRPKDELHLIETTTTDVIGKRLEDVSILHKKAKEYDEIEELLKDGVFRRIIGANVTAGAFWNSFFDGHWHSERTDERQIQHTSLLSALKSLTGK